MDILRDVIYEQNKDLLERIANDMYIEQEDKEKFIKKYHKKNFFIKFSKYNENIGTGDVMNTNFCKISVCQDRKRNRIIIISAIDNLIKGASGQAVQNMNVAFKLKETLGLQ